VCGRYFLILDPEIPEMQVILEKLGDASFVHGEITPGQMAPVIVSDGQGGWTARAMRWGFPHWKDNKPIINARKETVSQSSFFKPSFIGCRCLIPSNWFFEWGHTPLGKQTKEKYAIAIPKTKLMYMAGVYKKYEDGHEVFAVLTQDADRQVRPIHDRMPVMLNDKESRRAYLSGPAEAFMLLTYTPEQPLEITQTPTRVSAKTPYTRGSPPTSSECT